MSQFIVLLHILSAVALYCGLVGRAATFQLARRAGAVPAVVALLRASDVFERRLAIPGSTFVLLFGLLAAWRGGWARLEGGNYWLWVSLALYLALIPAIPLYLLPARRRRDLALAAVAAAGEMTPELRAALADRGVLIYRAVELVVVVVITVLMVLKPF
jgi:hypothetical protein